MRVFRAKIETDSFNYDDVRVEVEDEAKLRDVIEKIENLIHLYEPTTHYTAEIYELVAQVDTTC